MEVGKVVRATLVAVREYGLELSANGMPGFVQPIELSWDPKIRPCDFGAIGDELEVRIYAVTEQRFYASIKQVHPERNRWTRPDLIRVGTIHAGRVTTVLDWGVAVEIAPGLSGMLFDREASLAVGEPVMVEVGDCNLELRKLTLRRIPYDTEMR